MQSLLLEDWDKNCALCESKTFVGGHLQSLRQSKVSGDCKSVVRSVSIAESRCGEVTRIKSWDMGWEDPKCLVHKHEDLNGTVAHFCNNSAGIGDEGGWLVSGRSLKLAGQLVPLQWWASSPLRVPIWIYKVDDDRKRLLVLNSKRWLL